MSTPFTLDKENLRQAALVLRQVLTDARKDFEKRGYPGSVELVDEALAKLNPVLDLCIAEVLEEPFNFVGFMGKVMGDDLGFPYITKPFYRLCELARGGMTHEEFWGSEFYRRLPRQLRRPPEYEPSDAEKERIKADLRFKQGG